MADTNANTLVDNFPPADRATRPAHRRSDEGERHLGAVEGDRPTDQPNQGNPNAPGVDENGMPSDPIATCEDALGANIDESEGG